jgi:hypothetical protein
MLAADDGLDSGCDGAALFEAAGGLGLGSVEGVLLAEGAAGAMRNA